MKNTYTILTLLIGIIFLNACQKTSDLSKIEDSFTLTRNEAEMPVYVYGNAEDQIFGLTLHGGPGGNGLSFRSKEWHDTLEESYAMVYWDQRGSGMSQGNLSAENLNIEEMKKDVRALVSLLQHKYGEDITLFLLGHSWGTLLGGKFLAEGSNQELFNGYISASSIFDWCTTINDLVPAYTEIANEQIAINNDLDFWNNILTIAAGVDTTACDDVRLNNEGHNTATILENRGIINPGGSDFGSFFLQNNVITTTLNKMFTNDFLFDEFPFEDYDISGDIQSITIPSLVLHGTYDFNVAIRTGERYFNFLGSEDKSFHVFDKSAHGIFESESEKFGELVMEFIESHRD